MRVRSVWRESPCGNISALWSRRAVSYEPSNFQQRLTQTWSHSCHSTPSVVPRNALKLHGFRYDPTYTSSALIRPFRSSQSRFSSGWGSLDTQKQQAPQSEGQKSGWSTPAFSVPKTLTELTPEEKRVQEDIAAREASQQRNLDRTSAQALPESNQARDSSEQHLQQSNNGYQGRSPRWPRQGLNPRQETTSSPNIRFSQGNKGTDRRQGNDDFSERPLVRRNVMGTRSNGMDLLSPRRDAEYKEPWINSKRGRIGSNIAQTNTRSRNDTQESNEWNHLKRRNSMQWSDLSGNSRTQPRTLQGARAPSFRPRETRESVSPAADTNDRTAAAADFYEPLAGMSNRSVRQEDDERPRKKRSRQKADSDKDRDRRSRFFAEDEEFDDEYLEQEAIQQRKEAKKQRKREKAEQKAASLTPILLPEFISISNLATALHVRLKDFVYKLEELGFEETSPDHVLNAENAGLIAMEYGFEPIIERGESEDLKARPAPEDKSLFPQRPPVVTIMGHVDHGKTTLLDWLRKSSIVATEHGGITQHIGAFSVSMQSGKVITFLDTPGHAAFLSMRQRGANVTDIVVLVVAADDSVKPQTIEALNHASAAKVPIIVAINKIDKEGADVQRVKQDLARNNVEIEDFGGDTQVVCVSGKTGQGMEDLEETIITLSEVLDMRAETEGPAEGWVLETKVRADGKVATVLVKRGTMRIGDVIVAGKTWARIRSLRNEAGVHVEEALPGTPVEILGWRDQPAAGDEVLEAPDESKARSVIDFRLHKAELDKLAEDMHAINVSRKEDQERKERQKREAEAAKKGLEFEEVEEKADGPKKVSFIVKGDVHGSIEAVVDSVNTIGNNEVVPRILRSGVGRVSEFDIEHAATAGGHIINFNLPIDPEMSRLAETSGVRIMDHNIIYHLVDDVKETLAEQLPPIITSRVLGEAEIAQVFHINLKGRKTKPVAGCKVKNGAIARNSKVRVLRNGETIYEGTLNSLKNVKKDIEETRKGNECGMEFTDFTDFQAGDQIQAYEERQEKRYL